MKKVHLPLLISLFTISLSAQHLFIEAFSGLNRTAYDSEFFSSQDWYAPLGFRIAGGAENIQLGGEYHQSISNPLFEFEDGSSQEFNTSYYGGFLRANFGRYPAFGFGIILKAGAGMYTAEQSVFDQKGASDPELVNDYDAHLGFNGGLGFSIPVPDALHLEIGYVYNYVERPELQQTIPGYKAHFHSIQAGLSWNMVFGAAAKRNKHLKDNWKWRRGWRGKSKNQ